MPTSLISSFLLDSETLVSRAITIASALRKEELKLQEKLEIMERHQLGLQQRSVPASITDQVNSNIATVRAQLADVQTKLRATLGRLASDPNLNVGPSRKPAASPESKPDYRGLVDYIRHLMEQQHVRATALAANITALQNRKERGTSKAQESPADMDVDVDGEEAVVGSKRRQNADPPGSGRHAPPDEDLAQTVQHLQARIERQREEFRQAEERMREARGRVGQMVDEKIANNPELRRGAPLDEEVRVRLDEFDVQVENARVQVEELETQLSEMSVKDPAHQSQLEEIEGLKARVQEV
jgi:DNA repair exonuclease SbcCD ATPase subunit